ncbi:hypothetical protein LPTSP4_27850 [Leptospira ryugenii]|uniref:SxtJ n=1 Tax=Leptospira ryugenii TaxID=1917863 RepID=A0A2P2E2W8_9LEPT|nr:SxtJ family membrane protein [Leptospira ryugenii]GBF51253.1 hypothetical protein LPTSP4_27850 [Leptospira ryugenii]
MIQKETAEPTISDLRSFSWIVGGVTSIVFGIIFPYINRGSFNTYLIGIGVVILMFGLLLPKLLLYPYKAWMLIGLVLGFINTRILLSVIFFFLFTPIGLLRRLLGKDSMNRRLETNSVSYRVLSSERSPEHMERPF